MPLSLNKVIMEYCFYRSERRCLASKKQIFCKQSKHYLGDGGALDSRLVGPLAKGLGGRSPGGSRTTAEGGELVVISGSLVFKFFEINICA